MYDWGMNRYLIFVDSHHYRCYEDWSNWRGQARESPLLLLACNFWIRSKERLLNELGLCCRMWKYAWNALLRPNSTWIKSSIMRRRPLSIPLLLSLISLLLYVKSSNQNGMNWNDMTWHDMEWNGNTDEIMSSYFLRLQKQFFVVFSACLIVVLLVWCRIVNFVNSR